MEKIKKSAREEMYAAKRAATAQRVQDAIDEIQEDGRVVTKKELMELTGLSSGSFSQEYIKDVLRKNQVCQFKVVGKVITDRQDQNMQKAYEIVCIENGKLKSRLQDASILHDKDTEKMQKMLQEYDDLREQHESLRGKYQQLLEYLEILGADLSKMPLI